MSEREVTCDRCTKEPAVCVTQHRKAGYEIETMHGSMESAIFASCEVSCSVCCDHKAPRRCLPIVRYERGEEFDK